MRILLVNDDGIHAEGLRILHESAQEFGDCFTIAPHDECSAISHAITLHAPLRLRSHGPQRYAVTGTPTDCVYLGIHQLCDAPLDLVLSGINHGANLGVDVLYSGTVAAAMEGARAGIPSLAFSLAARRPTEQDWQTAGRVVHEVLTWYTKQPPLEPGTLLNVNIPKAPIDKPAPLCATHLGELHYPNHVETRQDPRGGRYYWIGGRPPLLGSDDPHSDTTVIQQHRVSITPLHLNLTDHASLESLRNQLKNP